MALTEGSPPFPSLSKTHCSQQMWCLLRVNSPPVKVWGSVPTKGFVIVKASGTMAKEKRKGDGPGEEEEVETNICFFFFFTAKYKKPQQYLKRCCALLQA